VCPAGDKTPCDGARKRNRTAEQVRRHKGSETMFCRMTIRPRHGQTMVAVSARAVIVGMTGATGMPDAQGRQTRAQDTRGLQLAGTVAATCAPLLRLRMPKLAAAVVNDSVRDTF